MTAISSLYSEQLLFHHKNPNGFNKSFCLPLKKEAHNAYCGDHLVLGLSVCHETQVIDELAFHGESCAVCRGSTSLMVQLLRKSRLEQAIKLTNDTLAALRAKREWPLETQLLQCLDSYPIRKQCAELPWKTVLELISNEQNKLNTNNKATLRLNKMERAR